MHKGPPSSIKSSLVKAHKACLCPCFRLECCASFSIGSEIVESLLTVPKHIVFFPLGWRIGLNFLYKENVLFGFPLDNMKKISVKFHVD